MIAPNGEVREAIRELWARCADAWGLSELDVQRRIRGYADVCANDSPNAIRAAIVPALLTLDRLSMSPAKFHALVLQQERQRSRIAESRRGEAPLCVYCGTTELMVDPKTERYKIHHFADCQMSEHGTRFKEPTEDEPKMQRLTSDELAQHGTAWREKLT